MIKKININLEDLESISISAKQIGTYINQIKNPSKKSMDAVKDFIEENIVNVEIKNVKRYPKKRRYPDQYPLIFASDKQQKFVMGVILKNKFAYRRTGRLSRAWKTTVHTDKNKIKIGIGNNYKNSKFIIGIFGIGKSMTSIKRYTKPMQKFHKVTGWQPAYKSSNAIHTKIMENSKELLEIWLKNA
jgi:hypothetical protein